MSNATRWYATREDTKAEVGQAGADLDSLFDRNIEAASEDIESFLGHRFIPETATKLFRWPPRIGGGTVLQLGSLDLIAITELLAAAQDTTPTEIVAADYFLEPVNSGPPYSRIEIDLSSSAAFESGDTPQRSLSVEGRWGYCETTKAAGALAEADDGAETALDVTDSSLIGVGDTILIGTEAMFVSEKALLDTTANTAGALTATKNQVTVPVNDGTLVKKGEVITIDSERMLIESISGNNLTVERAYDGSTLATHANPSDVYAARTMTVVRAVNGTTAAAHADAAAIVKYTPPGDIAEYCRASAIALHQQGRSGWTGMIGGSEGAIETRMFGLWAMRQRLIENYRPVTL